MPTKIRCPQCQGSEIARVSVRDPKWQLGEHRCKDCGLHAAWGLFLDPPLQMDMAFADAIPEEQKRRLIAAAGSAAFEMLLPLREVSERMKNFIPEKAHIKALVRGDVSVDELVAEFRESLETAVEAERKKASR